MIGLRVEAHHRDCDSQRGDKEELEQSHVQTEVSDNAQAENHEWILFASFLARELGFVYCVLIVFSFRGVFLFLPCSFLFLLIV